MGNVFKKKSSENNDVDDNDPDILKKDIYIPPLTDYKYFKRRVPYTTEEKEITESEQKKISELIPEKIEPITFPEFESKNKIKIIIDTDLGTDWDDAMAIMYALNLPNIEILGITTNYGIPKLRAKIVQKIIDAYEKKNPENKKIKVISGASRPLGTHRELMIYGHEGLPFFETDELKKKFEYEIYNESRTRLRSEIYYRTSQKISK